jgi:hypothetical protein
MRFHARFLLLIMSEFTHSSFKSKFSLYIGSTTFFLVVNTNAPHYFTHFYKFKHDNVLSG